MVDVLTKEQRKLCMSRNKGRDTGPEIKFRKAIWKAGFRYRLKSDLPGKPDIVFPSRKVAVFIDGCFWHGCKEHFNTPDTNREFWSQKIKRNIERDRLVTKQLEKAGWIVIRLWEHQIRKNLDICVETVKKNLQ